MSKKSYIFLKGGDVKLHNRLACFDVDWTIVKPNGGRKFPKDSNDLQLWHNSVLPRLQNLVKDQYTIIFFTNQKNKSIQDNIEKVNTIRKLIQVPFLYLASMKDDKYRKPSLGLWKLTKKYIKKNIDLENSFFVGDAAGRLRAWQKGKKKDFSDSDRKFSWNIGIPFMTPDEFFLDYSPTDKWEWSGWIPFNKLPKSKLPKLKENIEIVVVMGLPATGKTTFIQKYFPTYQYYSGDKDGNNKLKKLVENSMIREEPIVVEGLHHTVSSRDKWVKLAKQYGYNSRLLIMDIDTELSLHLNKWRYLQGGKKIPMVVYNKWKKEFQEPNESWDKITKIVPKWNKMRWQQLFL